MIWDTEQYSNNLKFSFLGEVIFNTNEQKVATVGTYPLNNLQNLSHEFFVDVFFYFSNDVENVWT